jgi:cell division protein FtsB
MVTWLKNPIVLFLSTLVVALFVWSQLKTLQKTQTSTENLGVLEQEINKISSQVSELQLATDSASVDFKQEKIARDELLLNKPGETLLQLPILETKSDSAPQVKTTPSPISSWVSLFFSK